MIPMIVRMHAGRDQVVQISRSGTEDMYQEGA